MATSPKLPIAFEPVPVRARHDGWTVERQYAFIQALAETGCVDEACGRVGMSDTSAYELRMRPEGVQFRRAWEAALDYSLHFVEQGVFSRSRHGVPRPIFYKGEQVGEWRHFDERLTMFLLRTRRPDRYGKWVEQTPPVEPTDDMKPSRGALAITRQAMAKARNDSRARVEAPTWQTSSWSSRAEARASVEEPATAGRLARPLVRLAWVDEPPKRSTGPTSRRIYSA